MEFTATLKELDSFAADFAGQIASPSVICLYGDLGAGKTTLVRLVLNHLGVKDPVPSPTFTLIQTYDTPRGEVWHTDLYRLGNPEEIIELGLPEAFETRIVFVEWPERLGSFVPEKRTDVYLKILDETTRHISVMNL